MLRGLRVVTILACGLVLAACGERREPVGPAEQLFPVTVTTADRELTIPAPPQRIVVLAGGPTSTLEAIGASVVASNVAAADVAGLRPDLVVAPSGIDDRDLSEVAASAPVYVAPGSSINEVERTITQLGLISAEPTAARRLVRQIERRRRKVARLLQEVPQKRVFLDLGRRRTAPHGSLLGDLMREARGINVAGDAAAGLPIGVKQLLALDPDVYVSAGGATLADLRKGARTRKLKAVQTGRVEMVDPKLFQPGPDIGRGLAALARALHPDAVR